MSKVKLTSWAIIACLSVAGSALAIDRAEVMDRARAFCYHPWPCTTSNLTATCTTAYSSNYVVGDHLGLPYDWGGYVSLHQFELDMDAGQGAGSPAGGDVLSCTSGLDCSGFVSQAWGLPHKYGTWTILEVAQTITSAELLPGDALNYAGYHIVIYAEELADGTLITYEANPPNTHLNWFSSWAGVAGFDPIRFDDMEPPASDLGSLSNPIPLSFPTQDTRNTSDSPSDLFDACGAAPGTDESGREYIYEFTIDQPGQLTATVSDGTGVDIDLHLYTHRAERDCIARHDNLLDVQLTECGTYLLVLDTWVNSAGEELAGPYTLTVDFTPSGGTCQAMEEYDYLGGPGDPCAYTGSAALPFCNPNLAVLTCLYSTVAPAFSFCTRQCASTSDCAGDFVDGCCEQISSGDNYCFPAAYCPVIEPDGGVDGDADGGVDAGPDGGVDAGPDGGPDGEVDAGPDGEVDAGPDGEVDAGPDGEVDAGPDGEVDAGPDGEVDAGPDGYSDGDGDPADDGGLDGGADSTHSDDDNPPADQSTCPAGYVEYQGGCAPEGWQPDDDPGGCDCATGTQGQQLISPLLAFGFLGAWWFRRRRRR